MEILTNEDDDDYSFLIRKTESKSEIQSDSEKETNSFDQKTINFLNNHFRSNYITEFTDDFCKANLLNDYLKPKLRNHISSEILQDKSVLNFEKAIIIGPPGSGKTSLVRRISSEIIYNFRKTGTLSNIPFYIQLRNLDYRLEFIQRIIEYGSRVYGYFDKDLFNTISQSGNAVFIFDGLDEISHENAEKMISEIKSSKQLSSSKILITSRKFNLTDKIEEFTKLDILPFSNSQIKELSFRKLNNSSWKNYYSILSNNIETHEFVRNPLLLCQSLNLYDTKTNNPSNTGVLTKYLIETLISNWNTRRGIYHSKLNLTPDKIKFLLGKLAYTLQIQEKLEFTSLEFKEIFELETGNEALKLLDNIQQITGVIQNNVDRWYFSHKTLHEYFCAFYLVERSKGFTKTYDNFKVNLKWSNIWKKSFGLSLDPEFYISNRSEELSIEYLQTLIKCQDILRESIILEKFLVNKLVNKTISFYEKFSTFFKSEKIVKYSEGSINNKVIRVNSQFDDKIEREELIFKLVVRLNFLFLETRWTIYSKSIFKSIENSTSPLLKNFKEIYLKKGKSVCDEHEKHADYFLTNEK